MFNYKKYIVVIVVTGFIVLIAYGINTLIDNVNMLKDTLIFGGVLSILTWIGLTISGGGFTDSPYANISAGGGRGSQSAQTGILINEIHEQTKEKGKSSLDKTPHFEPRWEIVIGFVLGLILLIIGLIL